MRKSFIALIAAAALITPATHAEGTPITVEFTYDSTLLASEAGAKLVLRSIKAQATDACSFSKALTGMPSFDRDCRNDLVDQAIGQIRLAAVEEGQSLTYVFASAETETETRAR